MLLEIKTYLSRRRMASLHELAAHLRLDNEATREMLQHWLRKGRVRRCELGCSSCGSGCGGCSSAVTEFYEWVAAS